MLRTDSSPHAISRASQALRCNQPTCCSGVPQLERIVAQVLQSTLATAAVSNMATIGPCSFCQGFTESPYGDNWETCALPSSHATLQLRSLAASLPQPSVPALICA